MSSANLAHTALRTRRHGNEHIMMFWFLRDGLFEKRFQRLSASHCVAQGHFSGNDQAGA
jgi:hypothetical protein